MGQNIPKYESDAAIDISKDESEDEIDFKGPENCELPHFLNTDEKWNECVKRTKTMYQYCQLIGTITNLNMSTNDKIRIMMVITLDIVMTHRYLSPHWTMLQQHAYFANDDIL